MGFVPIPSRPPCLRRFWQFDSNGAPRRPRLDRSRWDEPALLFVIRFRFGLRFGAALGFRRQRTEQLFFCHLTEGAVLADRKSTRLNSSHMSISYAVFCLKKKNKKKTHHTIQ